MNLGSTQPARRRHPDTLASGRRGLAAWLLALAVGVLAGSAVWVPPVYLAAAAVGTALTVVLVRGPVRGELVLALYWVTFGVFSTLLRGAVVDGMFYPFYAALAASALVALVVGGLRVSPLAGWTYVALLVIVVAALIGYTDSIPIDRLMVYPFGVLAMLQVRSRAGVHVIAGAAIVTSLAISAWVIVSAVQGGFAYRADVDVNQNVVSFYIGLGLVAAFAERLHGVRRGRAAWTTVSLLVALGVMAYALLLLASRGMILGLGIALAALLVRALATDRRRVALFVVLVVVAGIGLLLPGGQGILERFENPNTATGGGRTLIWRAIGEDLAASSVVDLAVGHGYDAAGLLVERQFGTLNSTHNAYLQVLYDFGFVGLALFLLLHGYAIVRSWRVPGRDGALMLGLVAFLLGGDLFMSTVNNFMYWTTLGFVLGIDAWHDRTGSVVR